MNNELSKIIFFNKLQQHSPTNCNVLNIAGIYCVVLFFVSVPLNSLLLYVLSSTKKFHNASNIFIFVLTFFNLIGSFAEFPLIIVSNFKCKWAFNRESCIFGGFVMYFIGCLSIYLLVAISMDRYYIIKNQNKLQHEDAKKMCLYIGMTIIFLIISLVWSLLPLFGWSFYSLQESLTYCCIEWRERSQNVVSYNIFTFGFVYLIPMVMITILNLKLIYMVKHINQFVKRLNQTSIVKKRLILERNLVIRNTIIIAVFFISWSPFAVLSMYAAFIDAKTVYPIASLISSMLTKSSFIWTPLIHIIFDKRIRKRVSGFNLSLRGSKKNASTRKL